MNIEINRAVPLPSLTNAFAQRLCRATQQVVRIPQPYQLSIAIVSNRTIQQMNRIYRKKDCPTDVLSFRYGADSAEVVLSAQKVRSQAKAYGHTQRMEAAFLLVHGVLHTLGWDHERSAREAKKMRALEVQILQRCGIDCAR